MDILNEDADFDREITSRYTIVIAASKRARQIINGAPCDMKGVITDKAVSVAVNEMSKNEIKIYPEGLPYEEEFVREPVAVREEKPIDFNEDDDDDDYNDADYADGDYDDDYLDEAYEDFYGEEEAAGDGAYEDDDYTA